MGVNQLFRVVGKKQNNESIQTKEEIKKKKEKCIFYR
jgi:hypothetical protein